MTVFWLPSSLYLFIGSLEATKLQLIRLIDSRIESIAAQVYQICRTSDSTRYAKLEADGLHHLV